ncbi:MAG: N-acetylmuramoyl-L-alanine amidase [Coriobacteriales bacterium]|nr:N-acetylmuramoyl-L-alanine amidase [Coriobacteriales bacterium]
MSRTPLAPAAIGWAVVLSVALLIPTALPSRALAAEPVRLMIDPGHGGKDPGTSAGRLREKDINLRVSRYVYSAARRQGWAVRMTRYDDTFIPLQQRPRKAAAFRATALVSVHVNSTGKKRLGAMTIHRGGSSSRLGASIMTELEPLTSYDDIGNRSDARGLAVLRGATTPAVITELRSLSVPEERRALQRDEVQKRMAEAIVRGVAGFHGVEYVSAADAKRAAGERKARLARKRAAARKPSLKPKRAPQMVLADQVAASVGTTAAVESTTTTSLSATGTVEPTATPAAPATSTVEPTARPIAAAAAKQIEWSTALSGPTAAASEPPTEPMGLPVLGIETESPLDAPDAALSNALWWSEVWRSVVG